MICSTSTQPSLNAAARQTVNAHLQIGLPIGSPKNLTVWVFMSGQMADKPCTCDKPDDLIPDKLAYQVNKRRMAWMLILLMAITTVLTLAFPDRLAEAESILMTQYISMCGLVGAYFGFSALGGKR